ncbi:thioredoxin domain-containing protein [Flexivirga sp. ID2601S]|uniref:Thioredoxin domain-containing protein n=1 Tax=Flexivirga aerilata TaxID=1656889 RepID=A0A849AL04_9MICO|nr:thioredoxin domain-containing protein [Flexivirga aerilata]NNG39968.1 thioredoxin domain-containing protein [Flexivirga aerilata]
MANRLADALSPYLRQHADNPVDWQEWGPEALATAREEDRPILLSVGYAACHWCHVMAHESFEDPEVAAAINAAYVPIKVDREERPDVDAAYMTATTAMTGNGGWPMTCLLTPDGKPFFAGTYLPKAQFLQLLSAGRHAWETQREQVLASGAHIAQQLSAATGRGREEAATAELADRAVRTLSGEYDETNAGFGTAPKFPPSMVLEFLLRHHLRTGDATSLRMAEQICEAMARGGMYDQLAGGFARYSVDATWTVPHFEKMLYDNAQLLRVYAHLWRVTKSELAERIAQETADFMLRDLRTPQGAFASALDADADGVEGLTYAWTPDQLREALGEPDAGRTARLLDVTPTGTFEAGASTLQLRHDPEDARWWQDTRAKLLARRRTRPQPARDDKVVTSWNGLAIAALAEAGMIPGVPEWVDAAQQCADHVLALHLVDGRLRRTSRDGQVGAAAGVADDYGNLAEGLLALHQATGDVRYLRAAGELLQTAEAQFASPDGGFRDTAADGEQLFLTPRGAGDNAEPSGTSSLAGALLTYSALTGDTSAREHAERAVASMGEVTTAAPRFAGWALAVAEAALSGPLQVAVVGDTPGPRGLRRTAWRTPASGAVVVAGPPDAPGQPLLAERPLVDGDPAAYVCRGFVCDRPVTSSEELAAALTRSDA